MKLAEALLEIVDAEAVLIQNADGSFSTDRPAPAEALEAINAAPDIALEFSRGKFFPTPEGLIALLAKTRQPYEWSYITARFTEWALLEALQTGKIEHASWDRKAGFAVKGWQAEYDSLRRLRGQTDFFCYQGTCPKCGQLRIHTGYTHRSGAYVCSDCLDSHDFSAIGDPRRLDEWSGLLSPTGRMKYAAEDKAPPAPAEDTQSPDTSQMNIFTHTHINTCTHVQINTYTHEQIGQTAAPIARRRQPREKKRAVFSLLDKV